jgi:hypothetical protein
VYTVRREQDREFLLGLYVSRDAGGGRRPGPQAEQTRRGEPDAQPVNVPLLCGSAGRAGGRGLDALRAR